MADELKEKASKSLVWSLLDKIGQVVITFITGIITMRALTPHDYGLIGALALFVAISHICIESGFGLTLLRKESVSQKEYSAVFYFNIALGVTFYAILYFCAPLIADYFHQDELIDLSRVLFLVLIINPMALVQHVMLRRNLKFKELTLASMGSVTGSLLITLILLQFTQSYWVLAIQQLTLAGAKVIILWILSPYKLTLKTSFSEIAPLFSFSLVLMLNSLITAFCNNIYSLLIGRHYSSIDLGHYSQSRKYSDIAPNTLHNCITSVSAPIFAKLNNELERQKRYMVKFIRLTGFAIAPTAIYLWVCIPDLISFALTTKWLPIVPYFRIFVLCMLFECMHYQLSNFFIIKGLKKVVLGIDTTKNIGLLLVAFICFTFFPKELDTLIMGYGILVCAIWIIDLFWLKKTMDYNPLKVIKDLAPYYILALIAGYETYRISFLELGLFVKIVIEGLGMFGTYLILCRLTGSKVLDDILEMVKKKKQD